MVVRKPDGCRRLTRGDTSPVATPRRAAMFAASPGRAGVFTPTGGRVAVEVGMHEQTVGSPRVLLGAGLIAFALLALPVSAHHGWGGYNGTQFELSGTVETGV